jgi:hypothetical protein
MSLRRSTTRRPSPAMAVAFVALLAALSGTAVALPGVNTVDSGDIRNGQVKGKDIGKNAVTGRKIKNGAVGTADVKNEGLTGTDIKNDSLTGADINEGTLAQVPSAASAGVANSLASGDVNATTVLNPDLTLTTVEASCDSGLKGISAGVRVDNPTSQFLVDLFPVDLDTWAARVDNGGTGGNVTLFIICGAVNTVTLP